MDFVIVAIVGIGAFISGAAAGSALAGRFYGSAGVCFMATALLILAGAFAAQASST